MTLARGISRELFCPTEADQFSKKELAEGNEQTSAQKIFLANSRHNPIRLQHKNLPDRTCLWAA